MRQTLFFRYLLCLWPMTLLGAPLHAQPIVYAWGNNGLGQLGDGTVTSRSYPGGVLAPQEVSMFTGARAIAVGGAHTLALRRDGTVWAWGNNASGELGDGTTTNRRTPVPVKGPGGSGVLTGVTALAARSGCSMALRPDGTVWAWGRNFYGQLGDGTTTDRSTPVQVRGPNNTGFLTDIVAVAPGGNHTVALRSDGTVWAWGDNEYGQLGNNTTTNRTTPVQVRGPNNTGFLTNVVAVSASLFHTVALRADGTVWTWGSNSHGQLGDGTTTNRTTPVQVLGPGVIAVSAGTMHTMALRSDGTIWAWGGNFAGQLGDGTTISRRTPVQVRGVNRIGFLTGIRAIEASNTGSMALGQDGTVYSWGYNEEGRFGIGSYADSTTPVPMCGPEGEGLMTEVIAMGMGHRHSTVLRADGTLWSCGYNQQGQLGNSEFHIALTPVWVAAPLEQNFFPRALAISAGRSHTVLLQVNGTVWAVGGNTYGQLGDGTTVDQKLPVQVRASDGFGFLTHVVAIAAGDEHTVALRSDGTVWAWGRNHQGQLGNGTLTDRTTPAQVRGVGGAGFLTDIVAIAARGAHTLALRRDGAVLAWGSNTNGQLGDGTRTRRTTPVLMRTPDGQELLRSAIAIAAGVEHSLVLRADGTVLASGRNNNGQLGDGTTAERTLPVPMLGPNGIAPLTGAVALSAGDAHSIVLLNDGTVLACGNNDGGQLGDGTRTQRLLPVPVRGPGGNGLLTDIIAVAAGSMRTMALRSDGTVWTWGDNIAGALGDGTTTRRTTPVPVAGPGGSGVLRNTVAISAGGAHMLALSGEGAILGRIMLQGTTSAGSIPLRMEFRPASGNLLTRTITPDPQGLFLLVDINPGEYQVAVKGSKWLQRVLPADTRTGSVIYPQVLLPAGDANDDNAVDVWDLSALIAAFDTTPGDPHWNTGADLNNDGAVDVLDLDLLIGNFDLLGDP
ncbi:MAG: dockerin type I domain-containing protein [Chloroherpetonaceae bacterium]|nr:dockerin type I domain-containing protein [Chthonomonadaceae bacterium]MDW8209104.1 dockerin type I domain-containing protein [Chloroherpetonaceae bacterium]